jgi:hypothetical protein
MTWFSFVREFARQGVIRFAYGNKQIIDFRFDPNAHGEERLEGPVETIMIS